VRLDILYRGPLASCNYGCAYCPFAKRRDSAAQLAVDRAGWQRFVAWVAARPAGDAIGVLVTPWGEALTRRWYQDGLAALSRLPQVTRAAAQTNLSARLDWIDDADPARLALWCTYHPAWARLDRFLARCRRLDSAEISYSVGVVGLPAHLDAARALRAALRDEVYVWINAVKAHPYTEEELAAWEAIDPLFRINLVRWPSRGQRCGAGERAITVDGDGTMRRCHFVEEPIGNLYEAGWERALAPRACTALDCHCHIGYAHLDYLELDKVFATGLLERVPVPEARAAGVRLPVVPGSPAR
jgi:MoaA/NifB/PqqE/SkfB family radical SAM enzyme